MFFVHIDDNFDLEKISASKMLCPSLHPQLVLCGISLHSFAPPDKNLFA